MVGYIFVPNGVYVLQRSRDIEKRQSWMISRNYQLCSTFLRWWSHLQEELCWGKTRNLLKLGCMYSLCSYNLSLFVATYVTLSILAGRTLLIQHPMPYCCILLVASLVVFPGQPIHYNDVFHSASAFEHRSFIPGAI